MLTAGGLAVQLERAQVANVTEQNGEGDKASARVNYCAQDRTAGRGTEPGTGRGRRVEGGEAGGGAVVVAERRRPGELYRRRSRGGRGNRGGSEEEEEREKVRRTYVQN
jgi:hypothetical protein